MISIPASIILELFFVSSQITWTHIWQPWKQNCIKFRVFQGNVFARGFPDLQSFPYLTHFSRNLFSFSFYLLFAFWKSDDFSQIFIKVNSLKSTKLSKFLVFHTQQPIYFNLLQMLIIKENILVIYASKCFAPSSQSMTATDL